MRHRRAEREQYIEETGEEPPTVDELMQGVEDEGDFDDARLAVIFEENGIPLDEETGDPIAVEEEVRAWDQDIEFARQLMNETFTPILAATPTEQDTETMQVDRDEDEEVLLGNIPSLTTNLTQPQSRTMLGYMHHLISLSQM